MATKAPPGGGQPQMMVQGGGGQQPQMVYMMVAPQGMQGQQWGYFDPNQSQQMQPNSGFAGDMSNMQQQSGPGGWNAWDPSQSNQQFGNQPQHQPAQQDFSGWGQGHQHQGGMQDQTPQMWGQPGSTPNQHQQHQQQQPWAQCFLSVKMMLHSPVPPARRMTVPGPLWHLDVPWKHAAPFRMHPIEPAQQQS